MNGDDEGVFALFVDLKKDFDLVDRGTFWRILEKKCGVQSVIVRAIKKLHDGMQTRTLYQGKLWRSFGTETGVRQDAIEGPTLL